MNMKKIIMVLISMALVFTMAGAVSADKATFDSDASGSGQTTVMISESIFGTEVVISFPDTVYLTGTKGEQLNAECLISISKAVFGSEHIGFYLSVSSQNEFTLIGSGQQVDIDYYMYNPGKDVEYDARFNPEYIVENNSVFLTYLKESDSVPWMKNHYFQTINNVNEMNSDVTDTLTFTIEYIAAEESTT